MSESTNIECLSIPRSDLWPMYGYLGVPDVQPHFEFETIWWKVNSYRPSIRKVVKNSLSLASSIYLIIWCSFWEDVGGLSTDWASLEAVVHHVSVVVVPEESPDTDVVASHDLSNLDVINEEVPKEFHEEDVLDGFTDWHCLIWKY